LSRNIKTPNGRPLVPMTDRVLDVLLVRCGDRPEGWLFPSKRSKSGHLITLAKRFREARKKAGLSESLALYRGRHDYGTRVLKATGNLAAVMKKMGHEDVRLRCSTSTLKWRAFEKPSITTTVRSTQRFSKKKILRHTLRHTRKTTTR